jgi:hypothetical protein
MTPRASQSFDTLFLPALHALATMHGWDKTGAWLTKLAYGGWCSPHVQVQVALSHAPPTRASKLAEQFAQLGLEAGFYTIGDLDAPFSTGVGIVRITRKPAQ